MVDPIGPKAIAGITRTAPVAPVSALGAAHAPAEAPVTGAAASATTSLQSLSQPAAAAPPVDLDRVAKIKKAIADGKFPTVPATIADRLLALKLEWNPNEPA